MCNISEVKFFARALDATCNSLGAERGKDEMAMDLLIRRLSALIEVEQTGN